MPDFMEKWPIGGFGPWTFLINCKSSFGNSFTRARAFVNFYIKETSFHLTLAVFAISIQNPLTTYSEHVQKLQIFGVYTRLKNGYKVLC